MRISKKQILQLIDELENVGWTTKAYTQTCTNEHCELTRVAHDKSNLHSFCTSCGYEMITTTDVEDTAITLKNVFKKIN